MNKIQQIQAILGVKTDGIWGPKSQAAFDALVRGETIHQVKASSFADPADIRAFKRCKAQGKSDQECFRIGDNGIGKWGDDTTEGSGPSVALPPDDWEKITNPRKAKVIVKANGREVLCELKDTMPRKKNIKNGAGIDLNPDACEALGLTPPIMVNATWQWA
jgi:hypothetical protein